MYTNATIRKGTLCFRQDNGMAVTFAFDFRTFVRIIRDDISVSEFSYKSVWYTVNTSDVLFDY